MIEKLLAKGTSVLSKSSCGLIAINKSAGVISHPSESLVGGDSKALLRSLPFDHRDEAYIVDGGGRKLYLLNRLDKGTSGVMLLCENKERAEFIRQAFARREVEKEYTALSFGHEALCRDDGGQMVDYMKITKRGGQLVVTPGSPGSPKTVQAVTRVSHIQGGTVDINDSALPIVLTKLQPSTGYSHQLRYQLYARNLPILGDSRYCTEESRQVGGLLLKKRSSLMLHSTMIKVDGFEASAPLPPEMASILERSTLIT